MMAKAETSRTDTRRELRTNHPDTWIAVDEGDTIRGTVSDVTVAWSDVQDQGRGDGWYPLLTVDAEEATGYETPITLKVHGMAAVLQGELIRAEAAPGETIEIVYNGTGEAKVRGRNAPELFRVRVIGRDPKEAAEKVYGQLRHKIRRPPTPPSPEGTESGADDGNAAQDEETPY